MNQWRLSNRLPRQILGSALTIAVLAIATMAAAPATAGFVDFESVRAGTVFGPATGLAIGDTMLIEDGVALRAEPFQSGTMSLFDTATIGPDSTAFGHGQVMTLQNLVVAVSAPDTNGITLMFSDMGGGVNLRLDDGGVLYQAASVEELAALIPQISVTVVSRANAKIAGVLTVNSPASGTHWSMYFGGANLQIDAIAYVEPLKPNTSIGCDATMDFDSPCCGFFGPPGDPQGTAIYNVSGMPAELDAFDNGSGLIYGGFLHALGAASYVGSGSMATLTQMSLHFPVATLGYGTVAKVVVNFATPDGALINIQVNGASRYVGNAANAPSIIASGVTMSLGYSTIHIVPNTTMQVGQITFLGNVTDLILGGQSLFLDDLCIDNLGTNSHGWCHASVDYQSLSTTDYWNGATVPVAFAENSIPVGFDYGVDYLGSPYPFDVLAVVTPSVLGMGSGNTLATIMSVAVYSFQTAGVWANDFQIDYLDYGGGVNLGVNNHPLTYGNSLADLVAPLAAQGVTMTYTSVPISGYTKGQITLSGHLNKVSLGGYYFATDNLCVHLQPRRHYMPYVSNVDFASMRPGAHFGRAYGDTLGQLITSQDSITVTLDKFRTSDTDTSRNWEYSFFDLTYRLPMQGIVANLDSVGLRFDFSNLGNTQQVGALWWDNPAAGNTVNITVNGGPLYFGSMTAAPQAIAPGVTLQVTSPGSDGAPGTLTFRGNVQTLILAGESLVLDDIGAQVTGAAPVPITPNYRLPVQLQANYPNPFNPSTTLRFALRRGGHVDLSIYDLAGHRVRTLLNHDVSAGEHTAIWHGDDDRGHEVPAGVYLVRVLSPAGQDVQKIALIK